MAEDEGGEEVGVGVVCVCTSLYRMVIYIYDYYSLLGLVWLSVAMVLVKRVVC